MLLNVELNKFTYQVGLAGLTWAWNSSAPAELEFDNTWFCGWNYCGKLNFSSFISSIYFDRCANKKPYSAWHII